MSIVECLLFHTNTATVLIPLTKNISDSIQFNSIRLIDLKFQFYSFQFRSIDQSIYDGDQHTHTHTHTHILAVNNHHCCLY